MREPERIEPYISVIARIWKQFPEARLYQLLLPAASFYKEDMELIASLCDAYNLPKNEYLMWGNRGKIGREPLRYMHIIEMEDDHLLNILRHVNVNDEDEAEEKGVVINEIYAECKRRNLIK